LGDFSQLGRFFVVWAMFLAHVTLSARWYFFKLRSPNFRAIFEQKRKPRNIGYVSKRKLWSERLNFCK
jgi:hypothetical protein